MNEKELAIRITTTVEAMAGSVGILIYEHSEVVDALRLTEKETKEAVKDYESVFRYFTENEAQS